jgi:cardiolipin synthase
MQELAIWIGSHAGAAVALLFTINLVLIAFVILLENREPERSFSWLLVLFTFPVIGFILYMFFGHNWHRKSYGERRIAYYRMLKWRETAREDAESEQGAASALETDLRSLITNSTGFRSTRGNRVRILTDAHVKYPRLMAAVKGAAKAIDMEYYIYRHDAIGRQIIEILKKKAKEGVRVRFLADGYGSFGLGRRAFKDMRQAGIEAHYFAPLITLFYFFKANYRDHRKIVLVDGEIAFTGGINIGDEYLGKSKRGPWRDTSLELRGPCVKQFAELFEEAWSRTTGRGGGRTMTEPKPFENGETVSVVPSGPDTDWFAVQRLYLAMISMARRSLKIETPYFIPDQSISSALVNAALRGVDVQIIVPRYPDNQLLRHIAATYLGEILKAGGRVFEYPVGFLHQKIIIADDEVATTGTCNIDVRSFHLDFEVNVLLSSKDSVGHLLEDFEHDLRISEELHYRDFIDRPYARRLKESLLRLIAPLL